MECQFDPGEPFSPADLGAALTRLVAEGATFLDSLDERAFFAPQGDRWSPADHVRHLRKSTAPIETVLRMPRLVLRLRFGSGSSRSRRFIELRDTYRGALARGGQAGRFAPSPMPLPTDPLAARRTIMGQWQSACDGVARAVPAWSERALDRAWAPHPLLGLLTIRELLEFTVYHTSHHLTIVAERIARRS